LKQGKLTTSERYIEDGKERTAKLHVHHVNELRDRPDLALSRWYTDDKGQRQPNLVPLCKTCHNIVHEKLIKWAKKDKFTNEERW
jgi:5-methylcytosine-specific restriction endonuclease McrA